MCLNLGCVANSADPDLMLHSRATCLVLLSLLRHTLFTLNVQGPVVQSVISLTSLLVVKIVTVLVSTISNSRVFFAEICE